nr:MAG TPA: hypothetical protein [Caudoviricetes sp.]
MHDSLNVHSGLIPPFLLKIISYTVDNVKHIWYNGVGKYRLLTKRGETDNYGKVL